jgi:hypothetical protein
LRDKPPDTRLAVRKQHSVPLLDALDAWADEHREKLGIAGHIAEALRYAAARRP